MEKEPGDYIEHRDFVKKIEEFLKNKGLLKKKEVTIDEDLNNDFNLDDGESDEESENEEGDDKDNKDNKDKVDKVGRVKAKKRTGPKLTIDFDKLISLMSKRITYVHKLIDKKGAPDVIKDGKFPGVSLFAEKAHGELITRVSHLGELGVDWVNLRRSGKRGLIRHVL